MKVNVGTSNSLKVEAVRAVFAVAYLEDDIEVNAINVLSEVPAQRVMSICRLMPITPLPRFFLTSHLWIHRLRSVVKMAAWQEGDSR